MYTLLRQGRLRWLGHVRRMEEGRIPKDLLYGELELGSRPISRPKLRFRDVCKRDMLATRLPADNWELLAEDRVKWKATRSQALRAGERKLKAEADIKRLNNTIAARVPTSAQTASGYICGSYGCVYSSRIGLVN